MPDRSTTAPGGALRGGVAVITGAASGFGLEACRLAAAREMRIVMADIEAGALQAASEQVQALGAQVLAHRTDVSKAADVEALGEATLARFGVPTFVFNNAGVGTGGLIWEATAADWAWVLGVNVMGVAHGVRVFTPLMLRAAARDPAWRGHVVNTASMAGLLNPPNMGVYNVSKHAVVALTETLYHDLSLVTSQVHAHVLCPYYVATGIHRSERNRPGEPATAPTRSQLIQQASLEKATGSGKVSAAEVAQRVFDAMDANAFYVFSHPHALAPVRSRMEGIVAGRNPDEFFKDRPEVGQRLREALRSGD